MLENSLDIDEPKEEEDVEESGNLAELGSKVAFVEVSKKSWNLLRVIKQTIYYVHLYALYQPGVTNAKGALGSTAEHPNFFKGNRGKGLGLSFSLH